MARQRRRLKPAPRIELAKLVAECAPYDILISAATGGERARGPFMKMDLDEDGLMTREEYTRYADLIVREKKIEEMKIEEMY